MEPTLSKPAARDDGKPALRRAPINGSYNYQAPGKPRRTFYLEPFEDIQFIGGEEWLVKRVLPRRGVAVIFGKSQSFKSFVALDLACRIAAGWEWAGLKVAQAPVIYIAAEGAAGTRKRKVGWTWTNSNVPDKLPFRLISDAPNLGAAEGDLPDLIRSVEEAGIAPGVLFVDTLAQTLGGGDENGSGMVQYIANAQALSQRFDCLVVVIHHVGLGDDQRLRGHSSLHGAVDAQILCERKAGTLATELKLQKLKDEDADRTFSAVLARAIIGYDEDDDEISTLVVESITEDNSPKAAKPKEKRIPPNMRLLMDVVVFVTSGAGFEFKPYANGPAVRAATEQAIRAEYYKRIAERTEPGEDQDKLADRQKTAFRRAINGALDKKLVAAADRNDERAIWTL